MEKGAGVEETTVEQATPSAVAEADGKLTAEEVEELKKVNLNDIDLSGFDVDPALVDEVEVVVRNTAEMICAEQPDVPRPEALTDLDSFSLVQILLELENQLKMKLLERVDAFEGATFRDLADFIVRLAYLDEIEKELAVTMQQSKEPSA
jgi:acyl carrier protein